MRFLYCASYIMHCRKRKKERENSILYFVYSGVKMYVFSFKGRIRNKFSIAESEIVLLVGSQTANTLILGKLVYRHLIKNGYKVFIGDLNAYRPSEKMRHLIIFTATYGIGTPPINANRFIEKWKTEPVLHNFHYSVVGFGSLAYPNFCRFADDVNNTLNQFPQAKQLLPIVKIHNQSYHSLKTWAIEWTQKSSYTLNLPASIETKKIPLTTFLIDEKKVASTQQDNETFTLKLSTNKKTSFHSGDLFTCYPNGDPYERFYSIGKIAHNQLMISVRMHKMGICSHYLNSLQKGDMIEAGIKSNNSFHYNPRRASVLIGNGTGMGAFLGMISENNKKQKLHLYWGGRSTESYTLYEKEINALKNQGKITEINIAFSRPMEHKKYVGDLVRKDGQKIALLLQQKAIIYICGSLAMQQDVLRELETISQTFIHKPLNFFQKRKQILMDCY